MGPMSTRRDHSPDNFLKKGIDTTCWKRFGGTQSREMSVNGSMYNHPCEFHKRNKLAQKVQKHKYLKKGDG